MSSEKKNLMLMVPMLHQGGFERVCVTTARLMQDYYNVYVLLFSSKNINYDVTGLNIVDINVPAKKGTLNKVINVFKRVSKVRKLKKELGIDISYSFGSSANYVNVLSKGKEKVLTGLRCQTDMERPDQVRLFCNRSHQVLSCSKEIMRQLSMDYSYEDSSYIYNPLDIKDIQEKGSEAVSDYPFNEPGVKVISCMARNDYIKGIWHLVKAFSLVAKEHPEARLMVLGAGDFSEYDKLAEELGITGKCAFPGLRKNPFAYVSKSDIYVCSSNHEGFPNAVLEAMALHKPLVSADCKTGPREILLSEDEYDKLITEKPKGDSIDKAVQGKYGILVPDLGEKKDLDSENITEEEKILAKEISRLLDDEELRNRYADLAFERANVYTPERYKNSIHTILQRFE